MKNARPVLGLAAALVVATVLVYWPVRQFQFVSFDDPVYVTENPHVAAGLGWPAAAWAFTSGYASNWHPITWLSHQADVTLFGMNPGPHHTVNLLLHVLNVLLLFVVLWQMTGAIARSAFVAALFALHPLHVESVAWVAERKDLLSAFFWLLTLWTYAAYARKGRWWRYAIVAATLTLGLMSKPMVVTLPFVLLLLDVWPLARSGVGSGFSRIARETATRSETSGWSRLASQHNPAEAGSHAASNPAEAGSHVWRGLVLEKLPLFALAAASAIVTFVVQHRAGAVTPGEFVPFAARVQNALLAYAAYIGKMAWPAHLSPFYPLPSAFPTWQVVSAAGLLVAMSLLVVRSAPRRPWLAVGWLWYLGTLVPTIGLVQVGRQAMADRYTYLPLVGLFVIVAWGVPELLAKVPARRLALAATAVVVVAACAVASAAQVRTWADSTTLWEHALAVDPGNYYAHNSLGSLASDAGRVNDAIDHFSAAIRLAPDYPVAHNNLGLMFVRQGRFMEASEQYRTALRLDPDLARAHDNLGVVLAIQGDTADAVAEYERAIRSEPDVAMFHDNLGLALATQGKTREAAAQFEQAIRLQPTLASAYANLGKALAALGRSEEAVARLKEALRLNPALVDAHNNLGVVLAAQSRTSEAVDQYIEALRLDHNQAEVHSNLGVTLAARGQWAAAAGHCAEALRLRPGVAVFHHNMGLVLAGEGRLPEAIGQFEEALRLEPGLATSHTRLALALTTAGRLAEALPHFEQVVKLQPDSDTAHQYLGIALSAAGRFDEGIAQLNEALRLNAGNTEARRALDLAVSRTRK